MARTSWQFEEGPEGAVLARRLPARFDVSHSAEIAVSGAVSLRRMAHQVRQDLWRALQNLRGFSPVVRVAQEGAALHITAGGRVEGCFPKAHLEAQIAALFDCAQTRARWVRFAARRGEAS